MGRGEIKRDGWTAWQKIAECLASRGTGVQPHWTLGLGTIKYEKGVADVWPRGLGKKEKLLRIVSYDSFVNTETVERQLK